MLSSGQNPENNPIPNEVIHQFIDNQKQKLANEAAELQLRDREITSNERLAMKSMEYQAEIEIRKPSEARKSITRLGYVAGITLIVVLFFLGYLITQGHKDSAFLILDKASYVLVAFLSFWAGRKTLPRDKSQEINNYQEVE